MTAKEANQKTIEHLLHAVDGEYQTIITNISVAASEGEFNIIVQESSLHDIVKARLITDGYKVTYNQGDYRDHRESSYYTIGWK